MVAVREVPEFMTVDAFLAWDAPDGALWQLVNGVPVAMAPANGTHAVIQNEVGALLRNHLVAHRPRCRALGTPGVIPRLDSEEHFCIPDIGVTCVPVPRGAVAIADPILLIEILSPGNTLRTWQNVRAYTTIPSVQEILVIRTGSVGVQLLRRAPDGTWPEVPLAIESGDVTLESIGFDVPVATLYTGTWLAETAS
jgi:Uma2 family endonuclease